MVVGLISAYFYYQWAKSQATVHFQKHIGETKIQIMVQKWQAKNPTQSLLLASKVQQVLGIHEEVRNETNPEVIQKRIMERMREMNEKELKEANKELIEVYKEYAPDFWNEFEKLFPWYLRYHWIVMFFIVLVSSGIGFGLGYFFEPKEEINY